MCFAWTKILIIESLSLRGLQYACLDVVTGVKASDLYVKRRSHINHTTCMFTEYKLCRRATMTWQERESVELDRVRARRRRASVVTSTPRRRPERRHYVTEQWNMVGRHAGRVGSHPGLTPPRPPCLWCAPARLMGVLMRHYEIWPTVVSRGRHPPQRSTLTALPRTAQSENQLETYSNCNCRFSCKDSVPSHLQHS